jgi:hypothetical protein
VGLQIAFLAQAIDYRLSFPASETLHDANFERWLKKVLERKDLICGDL